ncbi:uncharacterized protein LOC118649208 isoform X3 [Myotis myotis]|uniref:uncharacterized protein LOC118649208 isoform X3 n=1 Tax=Myotis myotis TaxID=51298 RepID=UPI00174A453E|nr:uncharacterized protein LOC118649208 isoform X3 [Myotis myotis]
MAASQIIGFCMGALTNQAVMPSRCHNPSPGGCMRVEPWRRIPMSRQGTVELQGCGHTFLSGGVGISGPSSAEIVPGGDGGELQQPGLPGHLFKRLQKREIIEHGLPSYLSLSREETGMSSEDDQAFIPKPGIEDLFSEIILVLLTVNVR